MSDRQALNTSRPTTLDANGNGRLELGPDKGPPYWNVTKLVVMTDRPGLAPVPQASVYLDTEDANGLIDSTYDGSKDSTDVDIDLQRGQHLIAVWSGGQAGDTATLSVTGWTETR
ncbi:hypothetical protein ACIO8H_35805 [Streptomyces sp. NPDC087226]|jgi:hypothetical protein|uniref:hypothetical protein n=1 Tax=Streptomyces sp. NPDC087226 TaxID=3365771 RepID=UPI00380220CA